ncbi:MAG: hypothetical protein INR69_16615 [Mucilaginibacter polytrichastri]|nr:hypothetical protein [Mucilaginibacter polytrichastri]
MRGAIYWEHEANIALRNGRWKMVAKTPENAVFTPENLELYNLENDPSEMKNLAKAEPERLQNMYADWQRWAERSHVFPLDTREYGARMQAYRRSINGTFDDNLGGWTIRKNGSVDAEIRIDTTAKMTGKKSAVIRMNTPAEKPADLAMIWNFPAEKGQRFRVGLKTEASASTRYFLRVEKQNSNQRLFDREIIAQKNRGENSSPVITIPEKGGYRVALYLGKLRAGDNVWVDDVKLEEIKSDSK